MRWPEFTSAEEVPEAFAEFYHEVDGAWVIKPPKELPDPEPDDGAARLAALREPVVIPPDATAAEYRRLKADAETSGRPYVIGVRPESANEPPENALIISHAQAGDVATYRSMKAKAEREGRVLFLAGPPAA